MISQFYLPLLKSKAGEFTALAHLDPAYKERIVPVFDVTQIEFDHADGKVPKSLQVHLESFCKKIVKSWPSDQMFVDTSLLNGEKVGEQTAIGFIYELLAKYDITPLPIVYPSSSEQHIQAIGMSMILYPVTEVGIRITVADITSSSFEEQLDAILTKLDITQAECHIIFDLKDADFSSMEDFSDGIVDVIKDFPKINDWKSFTIAGGAFPSMANIKETTNLIPRNDWNFYNLLIEKLIALGPNRQYNYGDYSIVSAGYFEFNPKIMSTSANIRYTHDTVWYVAKGRALKKSADWQQYYDQAYKIVHSGYYLGENFSWGDAHIKNCAERKTSTGNANTWIAVGTNHHFTKVISDLFAMSPSILDT